MEAQRIGPYRLEDRLGAGGMGVVYRAYDERLDRKVAIKVLHADRGGSSTARERLRREPRACARLSHPAVVRVFDLIHEGNTDAIVMELVEGRTLAERLREGSLDPAQALSIARDVAEGLAEAHDHGIIHRDLKSENVLITPDGCAKILDFGVAKQIEEGETSLTADGVIIGTARAMSPEQARGQEADARSDLFSLGVLLYEVFTGESPFLARTALATLERICTHLQPPARSRVPSLSRELSDLIDRLLEKEPERRPPGGREVARLLKGLTPHAAAPVPEGPDDLTLAIHAGSLAVSGILHTESERRQVTVLSCGLVRETGEALDPAELPEAMDRLEGMISAAVQRFDGGIERDEDGGWRALFGFPRAHEDDARRAVSAGLELASGIAEAGLRSRIGLSTGPLVVDRRSQHTGSPRILGEAAEAAAALRRRCPPGAVLVGPETCRLVEGFFELEEVAPSGPSHQPQRAFEAQATSGAQNRVHAAGHLTPLVGRDQELGILLERWDLAQEGRGQVVLLSGEAGLGKSRLVWELRRRLGEATPWYESHASPFYRDSAFHPILQWLDQWIGVERQEAPEVRRARLERRLAAHGLPVEEALPLLANLLDVPAGDRWPLPPRSPELQRRKTLETLLGWIAATAERQPLLLVIEDLHWADFSSLEVLGRLVELAGALPLLLLVTLRPEARIPWEERSHVTRLTLGPLSRKQTAAMIEQLTGGEALGPKAHEQIALRTDGVPLFVEELTKMLLELEGAPTDRTREIPGSLEGWLGARLDRLDTARQVAQLAAVLGRDFPEETLRDVAPWDAESLQRELDRLVAAEILYRQGFPPRCRYRFKHTLLQDAAYASLLEAERQRHHRRIAESLSDRFPEIAESQPELLAHHLTEAGLLEEAIPAWQRAGEKAIRASAYAEAGSHSRRALSLLSQVAESPERDAREIALQVALGLIEGHRRSYADPEVRDAYLRAWDLCSRAGSPSHAFPVLRGLFVHYMISGQMRSALQVSERTLELARQDGSPHLLLISHQAVGFTRKWMGDFPLARQHLETALGFGEVESPEAHRLLPGAGDPLLEGRCNLGNVLWYQGEPDAALAVIEAALAETRSRNLHFTAGFALVALIGLHLWRGEDEAADRRGGELASLSDEYELHFFRLVAKSLRAAAAPTEDAGAREEVRASIAARLALGARAGLPHEAVLQAQKLLQAGRLDEGAEALDTGFRVSRDGDQLYALAELLRLRGELLLRQGASSSDAEGAFRKALDVARGQGARSLELRAATSLARLWAGQGRRGEARQLLADVYGHFTEGFGTADLRAARKLLAGLDDLPESPRP